MTTKAVARVGILSAILVVSQVVLSPLPNVELVTLLFYLYAISLPLQESLLTVVVFSTIEMLIWGAGEWVIGYYWIWGLWVIIVYLLKNIIKDNNYIWALVHGIWGLSFGFLFAINYGIFYGFNFTIAYWIRGIPFDVVHSISNYTVAMVTVPAIREALRRLGDRDGKYNQEIK